MYAKHTQAIKDYLNKNVVEELKKQNGPELLVMLNKRWTDHVIMVDWMQKFFQYLDRFYVEMHSIASLNDQGYKIFKEIVFNPLCDKLTTAICNEVKKQRLGQQVMDSADEHLRNVVKIYIKLSTGRLANDGFLPRINLDKELIE